jgi:hemerythrin superfamily protein
MRSVRGAIAPAVDTRTDLRATDLLRADHERINALFDQYMLALNDDSGLAASLAAEICALLEAHSAVEKELFYPTVEPEAPKLVADSLRDHQDVDECVAAYTGMDEDDPDRESTMLRIMELVGQHVAEEEEILFPLMEERLPDLLRVVVPAMLARKEEYSVADAAR